MLGGSPTSSLALLTASTASPSDAFGARLKERVTTGNWPWCSMAMGAVRVSMVLKELSGTCPPLGNAEVDCTACDPGALVDPVELRFAVLAVAELGGPLGTGVPGRWWMRGS